MASFSVITNVASVNAQANLYQTNIGLRQALTRVSSGYRINYSGDDAAGLAVANQYRSDVAILQQGVRNASDGLSDLQIKDGAIVDVGGGTTYSMLATLGEAYKVQMLTGYKPTALELFWMATRGNAERLRLGHEIGTLETGKFADIVVLDQRATPVLAARQELSQSLEDMLFALMILGDDRAIRATYVAGEKVHDRLSA